MSHAVLAAELPSTDEIRQDPERWRQRVGELARLFELATGADVRSFEFHADCKTCDVRCDLEECDRAGPGHFENAAGERWCLAHHAGRHAHAARQRRYKLETVELRLVRAASADEWYEAGTDVALLCCARGCTTLSPGHRPGARWWFVKGCERRVAVCGDCWRVTADGKFLHPELASSVAWAVADRAGSAAPVLRISYS